MQHKPIALPSASFGSTEVSGEMAMWEVDRDPQVGRLVHWLGLHRSQIDSLLWQEIGDLMDHLT